MYKKLIPIVTMFCFFAFISCTGTEDNSGVAVGNPNISSEEIVVEPESGVYYYGITLNDDDTATVSQYTEDDQTLVESVSVNYSQDGSVIIIIANFSDGSQAIFTITVDDDNNLVSGELSVDGTDVDSTFTETASSSDSSLSNEEASSTSYMNQVIKTVDEDNDGTTDKTYIYTYNQSGQLTTEQYEGLSLIHI